ncbi:hypothetical protein TWF694_011515 [Orbilia ellipsospora]|uniref:Nephrocystin 3-like N-terminal domain-containing protein n=1 Tax=Orbilia ellipsospora TaxID=2528407 RepID=A0AAV9X5I2_9PEZI
MAEALGLASTIIGLASTAISITRVIVELIKDIQDAPEYITDLQGDVQRLRSILVRLETAEKQRQASIGAKLVSANDTNADDENDTLKDQLKYCKTVLKGVEDELAPVLSQMRGSKKQVLWASVCVAFTEKSIKEHASRISKAKAELLFTMVVDIRFAVLASGSSANSTAQPAQAQPVDSPIDFDLQEKRRDSSIIRDALRNKAIINKIKQSKGKLDPVKEAGESQQTPTFSEVIASTMDNMSKSVAGDYNISTFKMLWQYDLERIQSLWELDAGTVEQLKRTINDQMCKIFISSLASNTSTMNEIKDAAEGTLTWIEQTREFTDWQASNDYKLLLVEGKAGSGKSVFTKTLCQNLTRQSDPPTTTPVLLSYFCNKRVRAQESCLDILKAFIAQYFQENKSDFTTVYKWCKALYEKWDPLETSAFVFNVSNLLEILSTTIQVSDRRVYCVIDAMDESQRDDDMEVFLNRLSSILKRNDNARLFMSSRPDWIADNDLSAFSPLTIVLHPGITEKDISQLVELELCKLESKFTIDPKEKAALKKKLVKKSEGMMLWVVLAFRRIHERIKGMLSPTVKWLERMVEKLPREIYGMYDSIMTNIRNKYGKSHHHIGAVCTSDEDEEDEESSNLAVYGKLVLWVARSARPLTVRELQFALALDIKDTCLDDMKKRINCDIERVIGRIPFLEIIPADQFAESEEDAEENGPLAQGVWRPRRASTPSSTVRFIHQSAKEYILKSADTSYEVTSDESRFVYPKLDDACIGNLCVNFLSFKDFDSGPIREFKEPVRFQEGFRKFMEEYGFLEYSSSYWEHHLNLALNLSEATKAHVADWICNRKNNMRVLFQVTNFCMEGEWTDFIDGEFGLLCAAGGGIEWLTDYLILKGHDINERDEWGRTPFMLATYRGYTATAKKLVDAGADTDMTFLIEYPGSEDDIFGMICGAPASVVVKAMEQASAKDIETKDGYERTPVFYACARGDAELLAAVLERDPDLDVKDSYGRLPIDVTMDAECRELVRDRMKAKGLKLSAAMEMNVPCMHNMFRDGKPYFDQVLYCDFCGRPLYTFYFHCCECSCEKDAFNVCVQCHDKGKRCLETEHKLLGRVTADWLVSSLDYTPHMANAKVESPIKWSLKGGESDGKTEGSASSSKVQLNQEITLVQTISTAAGGHGNSKDEKNGAIAVVSVEVVPVKEKSPGCKCTIL